MKNFRAAIPMLLNVVTCLTLELIDPHKFDFSLGIIAGGSLLLAWLDFADSFESEIK